MTIFKTSRVTLLVMAVFISLCVAEYAVRYFVCPCGASCVCDPCVCGDLK
jgi:hypothetical protein